MAGSRQRAEQRIVGQLLRDRSNRLVVALQMLDRDPHLIDQHLDLQAIRFDDGLIIRERHRLPNRLEPLRNDRLAPHVVGFEEPRDARGPGTLELLQRRPLRQQVAEQDRVLLSKPIKHLRIIGFERMAQTVHDTALLAKHLVAVFHEHHELAHRNTLRLQRREPLRMPRDQIDRELGVRRIVLRPTGRKRFPVTRQHQGIDRKKHEKVVPGER